MWRFLQRHRCGRKFPPLKWIYQAKTLEKEEVTPLVVDGVMYRVRTTWSRSTSKTGKELWKTHLGSSIASGPMSYIVNEKQYIAVVSGNSLFTFALRR